VQEALSNRQLTSTCILLSGMTLRLGLLRATRIAQLDTIKDIQILGMRHFNNRRVICGIKVSEARDI
jgi:hypothetical protein